MNSQSPTKKKKYVRLGFICSPNRKVFLLNSLKIVHLQKARSRHNLSVNKKLIKKVSRIKLKAKVSN